MLPSIFGLERNTDQTMYEVLKGTAARRKDKDCIFFYGIRLSFGDFFEMVQQCAAAMRENGVKQGDRITICMPNIPQALAAVYATNAVGAICNLLHPLSAKAEVAHAVNLTGSKFAFCFDVSEKAFDGMDMTLIKCSTSTYFENKPSGWVRTLGFKYKIRGKTAPANVTKKIEWTDFIKEGKELLKKGPFQHVGKGEDTAAIMYTGGTTGSPKGVMLSNIAINSLAYMMFSVPCATGQEFELDEDGMLTALPIFHGFGFAVCMHVPICLGIRQVIFPTFDAKACSHAILKHKLTLILGVPAFYEKVYKAGYLKDKDLSYVKLLASGGDVVPHTLSVKMDKMLAEGGCKNHFVTGYGQTECVTVCTLENASRPSKAACLGEACEGMQIKTVRMGTTEEVVGEDGELCVWGPTLMQGYYNDPEETAKTLKLHPDGKVWLHTGDLCMVSENGDVYYRQRIKRVLKISGYLVYPSFIEETLRNLDAIGDCCVIGDETNGRTSVKLYVVPKHALKNQAEKDALTEKIVAYAVENLSKWSVPRTVEYLEDDLPRTKVGKVNFKALEEMNEKTNKQAAQVS